MQVPQSLAAGQLANTASDIYTAASAKAVYLSGMTLFNTNAASQTIIIYLQKSATNYKIYRLVLAQNESAWVDFKGIILSATDKVRAETTTASAVDYFLSGIVEDV